MRCFWWYAVFDFLQTWQCVLWPTSAIFFCFYLCGLFRFSLAAMLDPGVNLLIGRWWHCVKTHLKAPDVKMYAFIDVVTLTDDQLQKFIWLSAPCCYLSSNDAFTLSEDWKLSFWLFTSTSKFTQLPLPSVMSSINNDSVSLDPIRAHASPCLSIVEFYKWFATSGESIFSPVKTSVYGDNNIPISWRIFFN